MYFDLYDIYNAVSSNIKASFFNDIGLILTILGCCGVLANRYNIIISIIAIELMFYGLNFYLVTASLCIDDIGGEIFSLFVLTIAASESSIALALMTSYFKVFKNIILVNN